jgi:tetratricopeptide (TPR) repeat protein
MASQLDVTPAAHPAQIGVRYRVDALLGRGGMATVYRVTDAATGRPVALKQLAMPHEPSRRSEMVTLFEREFHALAQLSHPQVIEVYDYGVDETGPYYTMELLDGGDLRSRAPLPWRQACTLLCGVGSSLALIHSRRLVHRDVSPANIWCTREGEGKLIDFGALAPMGEATSIVGTPAFVAPEVVQRAALDGRTDLFSFGATLYFALTGRPPYPARSFSQLAELWALAVPAPSTLVDGIPEALDALVMSLLCPEPAMRPRAAFEVMQRLSAIAGIESVEPLSVSQAYLSTPLLVGRQREVTALRERMVSAFGGGGGGVLLEGESGVGRSRMLEACVVEAKMLGAATVRAGASAGRAAGFAVAQTLAEQLLETLPDAALASARASGALEVLFVPLETQAAAGAELRPRLRAFAEADVPGVRRQKALSDWMLHVSETHRLAIAIDDAHEIDEPSAALLAVLARQAGGHRLLVAVTAETGAARGDSEALQVFTSGSTRIELQPLTRAQTEELLGSLFGDVQNLGAVSDGVHRVSAGSPRACIDLAKHLIDKGVIRYESGGWTLPARLDPSDLPGTAEGAIRDRIAALQPLARWLVEAQSLASDQFSREDYRLLRPEVEPGRIDRAISELVSHQVLVGDNRHYALAHRGWAAALLGRLSPEEREQRHQALAVFYEGKVPIAVVHHLLAGGLLERGLDRVSEILKVSPDASGLRVGSEVTASQIAATIQSALDAAETLKRPTREINDLRQCLMSLSVRAEDAFYWRATADWLAQLKRDSGLLSWLEIVDDDPGARLRRALGVAAQNYAATAERDRGYRPDEAVRALCHYAAISIAIGSRSLNVELLATLPGLLEPFAPLSPVVALMLSNTRATCESRCHAQFEQARARNLELHERLGTITRAELPYVDVLRNAIAFALGSIEARMGLASATSWIELLEKDLLQQVNALLLRKILALQVGDAEGAERYRREAELLALQARVRQMFTTTVPTELAAHALAGDLSGVQQVKVRILALADAYPGWRPYAELAEGQFQQLRGNLDAAREAFERCIAMTSPDPDGGQRPTIVWPPAVAAYLETLVGLGRHEEAKRCGERALATCETLGIGVLSHDISRALALAEAKLGDHAKAVARLDALIATQRQMGVAGLILGASYEARARIAIWAGDEAALTEYAALTAREYRHGRRSPLGARWEQLMAEARRASKRALTHLVDFGSTRLVTGPATSTAEMVSDSLRTSTTRQDRVQRTLKLLCDDRDATVGYLYLIAEPGLTLAASQGSSAPPEGLLEHLNEYLERELSGSGDATAFVSAEMDSSLHARPCFRDDTGLEHRLVLLTTVAGGVARHAGVAVLVEGARTARPAGGAELVAALSTHLIEAGDARGIAS